jgi:hypothetical protein
MKKTMKVTPKSTGIINRILLRIYINIKIPDSGPFPEPLTGSLVKTGMRETQ